MIFPIPRHSGALEAQSFVSAIETEYRSVLHGIDASYADFVQATRTDAENRVNVDQSFTYSG